MAQHGQQLCLHFGWGTPVLAHTPPSLSRHIDFTTSDKIAFAHQLFCNEPGNPENRMVAAAVLAAKPTKCPSNASGSASGGRKPGLPPAGAGRPQPPGPRSWRQAALRGEVIGVMSSWPRTWEVWCCFLLATVRSSPVFSKADHFHFCSHLPPLQTAPQTQWPTSTQRACSCGRHVAFPPTCRQVEG